MNAEEVAAIGEDVPLLEGIRTCRAIRRLKSDPVSPELIRKVCEAGTFAPSGGNRQPWIFVAVTEAERKRFVADLYRPTFHEYIEPALDTAGLSDRRRRNALAALHLADHLHEAPVLLFVAGWKRRGEPQLQALFPCIQNILLACRAVGLGASLTTLHRMHGRQIDDYLGLDERTPSCAMLPIGWPKGRYGRPPRESIDTRLHWERFTGEHG